MSYLVPLVSFPRSGNTWMRVLLAHLFKREDLDIEDFGMVNKVTPTYLVNEDEINQIETYLIPNAPIFIKEHCSYLDMSYTNYDKAIYIYRNKEDTLRSYWRYTQNESPGLFPNYRFFLRCYNSYCGFWEDHVDSWIRAQTEGRHRIFIVKYEDLVANTFDTLRSCLQFLECQITDEKIGRAIQESSVGNMKNLNVGNIFPKYTDSDFSTYLKTIEEREKNRVSKAINRLFNRLLLWYFKVRYKLSVILIFLKKTDT